MELNQKQKICLVLVIICLFSLIKYNQTLLPEPPKMVNCPDPIPDEVLNTSKIMFCNNTKFNDYNPNQDFIYIEIDFNLNGST